MVHTSAVSIILVTIYMIMAKMGSSKHFSKRVVTELPFLTVLQCLESEHMYKLSELWTYKDKIFWSQKVWLIQLQCAPLP